MKVICAWCGKVIQDGPDEPVSHGICLDCRIAYEPEPEENPPADDFFGMMIWLMKGWFYVSLLFFSGFCAVVLLAELLHWLTGGWFPSLMPSP